MAGHQSHLVELRDVPCGDQIAAGIRVILQSVERLLDLIDVLSVWGGPGAPLHAVDRAQLAVLIRPLVPDADLVLLKELNIGLAFEEPQKLAQHRMEVDLLGGQQREGLGQVIAQLRTKNGARAGAGAIAFGRAGL